MPSHLRVVSIVAFYLKSVETKAKYIFPLPNFLALHAIKLVTAVSANSSKVNNVVLVAI